MPSGAPATAGGTHARDDRIRRRDADRAVPRRASAPAAVEVVVSPAARAVIEAARELVRNKR